jgi:peptide/nickel transport system permease protein
VSRGLGYLARRVAWAFVVVLGVTSLSFFIALVLPGDPARMLVGPQASAKDVAHIKALYGLDEPLPTQYARYVRKLVHFGDTAPRASKEHASCASLAPGLHIDLGYSFHYHKPVVDLLTAKIPRSVELGVAALLIQLLLGVGAGALAAARRRTRLDEMLMSTTLLGLSAPTFLIGLFLQYLLAYQLRLLPYDGYGDTAAEHLASIVLPALTLGIYGSALYARLTRDELGTLLEQDFVRGARAKGASRARALVVHALRNALVPIVTLAALDLGTMVGGAVITEKLFRWPGVGQMAIEALLNRDGPVIFGTVLFSSIAVVASTLLIDLLQVALNPRRRARREA